MGSVISYVICSNCKSENCTNDFYYKTNEEFTQCPNCGYSYNRCIRRDESNNFVLRDASREPTFDNLYYDEEIVDNPFGSYFILYENRGGSFGTLTDQNDYTDFIEEVVNADKSRLKGVSVSRFVDNNFFKEIIYSKDGRSFQNPFL